MSDRLDIAYLASLTRKAQEGGSNAFAELYTATYQSEYNYSWLMLQDDEKAKAALKETFKQAMIRLSSLKDTELVVQWLYSLNFEVCSQMLKFSNEISVDGKKYKITQLTNNLPMTEAQALIMYYYQGFSVGEIAKLLGINRSDVRWNVKDGKKHLKQLLQQ